MSRRIHGRVTVLAAVSLTLLGGVSAAGQGLQLSDWGIRFPDGSELTSAAGVTPDYANVLIVAKSGGHFSSIQAALDAIGGSLDLPAATRENPYIVWVAPGVYEEQVTMKEWVDIQGAGQGVTRIIAPGRLWTVNWSVRGADNAELSFLTVEQHGAPESSSTAIWNLSASPVLSHVTAIASGGNQGSTIGVRNEESSTRMEEVSVLVHADGTSIGVRNLDSSLVMDNVTIVAMDEGSPSELVDRVGILSFGASSLEMTNAKVSAMGGSCWGVKVTGGSARIERSRIEGGFALLTAEGHGYVAATRIEGEVLLGDDSTLHCMGAYDQNFDPLDENCQPIP